MEPQEVVRKRQLVIDDDDNNTHKRQRIGTVAEDNKPKYTPKNVLVFLCENTVLRKIFSSLYDTPKQYRLIFSSICKELLRTLEKEWVENIVLNLESTEHFANHKVVYPHKYLKMVYDEHIHSIKPIEEQMPNLRNIDITIQDYVMKSEIRFSKSKMKHLKQLVLRNHAELLDATSLPPSLETLVLQKNGENPLMDDSLELILCDTIQTLVIDFRFDGTIDMYYNLKNLYIKSLKPGRYPDLGLLPDTLQRLHLGDYWFSKDIETVPPNLTHLYLGKYFNGNIDVLKNSKITHLFLGANFNNPVDSLPDTLIQLNLGDAFDFPIDNLPSQLQILGIGASFNQSLNKLPKTLTYLKLESEMFNQPTVDALPDLLYLEFNAINCHALLHHLPSTLETFIVHKAEVDVDDTQYYLFQLVNLQQLSIMGEYDDFISDDLQEMYNITHVNLDDGYDADLLKLPDSLVYLRIGAGFQSRITYRDNCKLNILAHPLSSIGKLKINGHSFGPNVSVTISEAYFDFSLDIFDCVSKLYDY